MIDIGKLKAAFRDRNGLDSSAPVGWRAHFSQSLEVKAENGGTEIEGVVTTDDVDLDEEVVLQGGLDWTIFNKTKSVYADHEYGILNAVGHARWVSQFKSGTGAVKGHRSRIRLYKSNPLADQVKEMAQAGALGFSIGFMVDEAGPPTKEEKAAYPNARNMVRKAQVFEFSATPMPCNVACMSDAIHNDESKDAAIRALVTKGLLPKTVLREALPKRKTIIILSGGRF